MNAIRGAHKVVKQLAREYRELGWTVEWLPGGHVRWRGPLGELVVTSATPSDFRWRDRVETDMRRQTRLMQQKGTTMTTKSQNRAEAIDQCLMILNGLREPYTDSKLQHDSLTADQIEAAFWERLDHQAVADPRQLVGGQALAMRCLHQAALVSIGKAKERDPLPEPVRMKPLIPLKAKLSITGALTMLDCAIYLARREASA